MIYTIYGALIAGLLFLNIICFGIFARYLYNMQYSSEK